MKRKKTNQRLLPYNDGTTCACLIVDWKWWLGIEDEIHAWMDVHLVKGRLSQKGMTVEFSTPEELTLFVLRWC